MLRKARIATEIQKIKCRQGLHIIFCIKIADIIIKVQTTTYFAAMHSEEAASGSFCSGI